MSFIVFITPSVRQRPARIENLIRRVRQRGFRFISVVKLGEKVFGVCFNAHIRFVVASLRFIAVRECLVDIMLMFSGGSQPGDAAACV